MKTGWNKITIALRLALCLLPLFTTTSFSADLSDKLNINAFYTFDLSISDGADVTFSSPAKTPVTLKDGEASLDNSLIGAQVDYSITDDLKLVVQAISSKQTDENYSPTLEWAYASWDLGDDLFLRGGKLNLPFLQGTELRNIGFSRLWIRPLTPSNGAGGFDDYIGGEVIKGTTLGDYNITFQGVYGVADHKQDFVENRDVKLLSTRVEKDESWVNLALFHARYKVYTVDQRLLIEDNAEMFMASVESELLFDSAILNLGYVYGEADVAPNEQLAYFSLGYRANRWIPYFLVEYHLMRLSPFQPPTPTTQPNGAGSPAGGGVPSGAGAPAGGVPNGAEPPAGGVPNGAGPPAGGVPNGAGPPAGGVPNVAVQPNVKDGDRATTTYALGIRYNLGDTYAIKVQVDQVYKNDDTDQLLGNVSSEYRIYTIVFEGVF